MKVQVHFHLNGHIVGFHLHTQKLKSPYESPSRTLSVKGLISSMITDQIGLHKRLLQLNHNYNKMCDILGFFKIKMQEILQVYS